MKKLMIITGVSGSGKTTLAKYIQSKIENVTLITLDTIFEAICDTIGFQNRKGKKRNCTIAKKCVKDMIEECMKRKDEIIMVDYPFEASWENFFKKVSSKYEYDVLTVKLYAENFERQWERTSTRDLSSQRHVMHESPSYNPKDKEKLTRNLQSKEELKQICESGSRTKILVGKELKIINKNEKSIKEAFSKIEKWLKSK